jgi:hypothetical protein
MRRVKNGIGTDAGDCERVGIDYEHEHEHEHDFNGSIER